jgi:hypothetical protein
LHLGTDAQMLDQPAEGGRFKLGAGPRVESAHGQDLSSGEPTGKHR